MIKIGLVGAGKMGISHLSIARSHPDAEVGVCDSSGPVVDVLAKYTGAPTWRDYDEMLDDGRARRGDHRHAVAARTGRWCARRWSAACTCSARSRSCLDWRESEELAAIAAEKGLVDQVGYHYRYVGAFQEMKRLVDAGAHRRGHPCAGRGLRAGGPEAQGRDLAHRSAPRAAAASTTTRRTRST